MIMSKSVAVGDGDRFCADTANTLVRKTPRQKRFHFIALIQEASSGDVDLKRLPKAQAEQHASARGAQHESVMDKVSARRSRALHVVRGGSSKARVVV